MSVVITGAAGFVGGAIARRALADGKRVVGIDIVTPYYDTAIKRRNIAALIELGMEFHEIDLVGGNLAPIIADAEVIFHEAGQPGVRGSWGNAFQEYSRNNIEATQRLLEASVGLSHLSAFVFASSSSIYGNASAFPTAETALPAPVSPYGVSKLAAEHLCSLYAVTQQVPTVSLRYFTVYGPGQRPEMAFSRFCSSIIRDEPITLYGDGTQIRDFTYIDDVVDANFRAATSNLAPGTVLNVAGGSSVSVNDVLETLAEVSGRDIRIDRQPAVLGDARQTGGDTARIRHLLGWVPATELDQGLARQYEWVRSRLSSSDDA